MRYQRGTKAFTLLELIVVIVILGILAAIAIPTFMATINRSKDKTSLASMQATSREAIALSKFANASEPHSWAEAGEKDQSVRSVVWNDKGIADPLALDATALTAALAKPSDAPRFMSVELPAGGGDIGVAMRSDNDKNCVYSTFDRDTGALLGSGVAAWSLANCTGEKADEAVKGDLKQEPSGPPATGTPTPTPTPVETTPPPAPETGTLKMTYNLAAPGCTDTTIVLPTNNGSTGTVNWGDGTTTALADTAKRHTYEASGTYQVAITDAKIGGLSSYLYSTGDTSCLTSVDSWNDALGITTLNRAFQVHSNLTSVPANLPSTVKNLSFAFYSVGPNFNQSLNSWNTSGVTNMASIFSLASSYTGDISGWDVSSVEDMSGAFAGATAFNSDISGWKVGNVKKFDSMFSNAQAFSANIEGWDTVSATSMRMMFNGLRGFNQDLNGWDVSKVQDMYAMFADTSFNHPLTNWDVSQVKNFGSMFARNTVFNGDISNWKTTSATDFSYMFDGATSFNQNLSGWTTDNATNLSFFFRNATGFTGAGIENWNVSKATTTNNLFFGAREFNSNISSWRLNSVTNINGMFTNAVKFNQDLSSWILPKDRVTTGLSNYSMGTTSWVLPKPQFPATA